MILQSINYAYENPLNSLDLGDLTAVTSDITILRKMALHGQLPDAAVLQRQVRLPRSDETKTATLTAKMTKDGVEFTRNLT